MDSTRLGHPTVHASPCRPTPGAGGHLGPPDHDQRRRRPRQRSSCTPAARSAAASSRPTRPTAAASPSGAAPCRHRRLRRGDLRRRSPTQAATFAVLIDAPRDPGERGHPGGSGTARETGISSSAAGSRGRCHRRWASTSPPGGVGSTEQAIGSTAARRGRLRRRGAGERAGEVLHADRPRGPQRSCRRSAWCGSRW